MSCLSLLQGVFPTQGLNQSLLHCRQILYHLSHQGSPYSIVVYYKILSIIVCACMLSHFSPVQLCYPMDYSLPGFSRQEYWSGFLCPPPRDLPYPWIELASLLPLLPWQSDSLLPAPPGKPHSSLCYTGNPCCLSILCIVAYFFMWTIFKTFTDFVTIWLLFYVLDFWHRGTWYLSSPTTDGTCAPCILASSPACPTWKTRVKKTKLDCTCYGICDPGK